MRGRLADLHAEAARLAGTTISSMVADDPQRVSDFSMRVGPLYANFARQRYDRLGLETLFGIAEQANVSSAMQRLIDGETVNTTEGRPALHTALRGESSSTSAARDARAQALAALERMRLMIEMLSASDVTDIVSIGIGGSDLGPRLMVDALALPDARFRVHFMSNVDGNAAQRVLGRLDP
ncbi:MAG: glucose-6-phosphate isomerase, partial [Pseudomonadota bacterium]|nr:glucose-6-phosphate isomerase [Pseudomonadota bacterium]